MMTSAVAELAQRQVADLLLCQQHRQQPLLNIRSESSFGSEMR